MLELDVAGLAHVGEGGIEIERAPEGVTFELLPEDHPRLHELVGWDEKFAAHNAAAWQAGLLVRVPKGVVVEQPLYVRVANAVEDGSLFWRLLVEVEESASLTLIEEYASATARPARLLELGRGALRRPEREARVRLDPEPLPRDVALRHAPRARRPRRRARLGRRRLRLEEGQGADPERPRRPGRDLARDGRLLRRRRRSISTTTPSRSTSRRGRRATSPSRARCATGRRRCGAG